VILVANKPPGFDRKLPISPNNPPPLPSPRPPGRNPGKFVFSFSIRLAAWPRFERLLRPDVAAVVGVGGVGLFCVASPVVAAAAGGGLALSAGAMLALDGTCSPPLVMFRRNVSPAAAACVDGALAAAGAAAAGTVDGATPGRKTFVAEASGVAGAAAWLTICAAVDAAIVAGSGGVVADDTPPRTVVTLPD
jgi:hypothetical protein